MIDYIDRQVLLKALDKKREKMGDYPYSISVLDGIVELIKALPTEDVMYSVTQNTKKERKL